MKGYRIIAVNVVSLLTSLLLMWGIEVDAETQAAIATGVLAVINVANVVLRFDTDGPVGR
jgi:hypothetical protein